MFDRHDHAISVSVVGKGAARLNRRSWAVGELVRKALSTVDPVAYSRIALVYRNFREAKVFWRVLRAIAADDNKGRLWVQRPLVIYVGFAGRLF